MKLLIIATLLIVVSCTTENVIIIDTNSPYSATMDVRIDISNPINKGMGVNSGWAYPQ